MKKAFYFIPLLPVILGLGFIVYKILVFAVMIRPVMIDLDLENSYYSILSGNNIYKEFISISAVSLVTFLILLVATIVNIFKKNIVLLIICLVVSISAAVFSVETTTSRLTELSIMRIVGVTNMDLEESTKKLVDYIKECSCQECVMELYDANR